MSGFWLLLIFLIVRFGLLYIIKKEAIQRAGYFAPIQKSEKIAYYIYQFSNMALLICLIVSSIKIDFSLQFYLGLSLFLVGILLCAISVVCFAFPNDEGLNINGIYKYSRNPIYVAYFVCFLGMSYWYSLLNVSNSFNLPDFGSLDYCLGGEMVFREIWKKLWKLYKNSSPIHLNNPSVCRNQIIK